MPFTLENLVLFKLERFIIPHVGRGISSVQDIGKRAVMSTPYSIYQFQTKTEFEEMSSWENDRVRKIVNFSQMSRSHLDKGQV